MLIVPDENGVLPFSVAAVVRLAAVDAGGNDLPASVLTGISVVQSLTYRTPTARQIADTADNPFPPHYGQYHIDVGGTYRMAVSSFGLVTAMSAPFEVIGGDVSRLSIDAVPLAPQVYGGRLMGPMGASGRRLSVSLFDAYGNANTSSGVLVDLPAPPLKGLIAAYENLP